MPKKICVSTAVRASASDDPRPATLHPQAQQLDRDLDIYVQSAATIGKNDWGDTLRARDQALRRIELSAAVVANDAERSRGAELLGPPALPAHGVPLPPVTLPSWPAMALAESISTPLSLPAGDVLPAKIRQAVAYLLSRACAPSKTRKAFRGADGADWLEAGTYLFGSIANARHVLATQRGIACKEEKAATLLQWASGLL